MTDCTILSPRENEKADEILRTSFLLAKQAGLDPSFTYALDPIPDSPLYLLPCPLGNKAITKERWNELLGKVENGSRLFMTLSRAMFREIPETFGVRIDYRYERTGASALNLGGKRLPVDNKFTFDIHPTTARVLACDDEGMPVLFENDYGKGKTYLCILPLEEYVGDKAGAFFDEDAPAYHLVYREIAKGMEKGKISESDSPYLCRTEHVVDENNRYLFLINYDSREQSATLTVEDGWSLRVLCGEGLSGNRVTLRGNDGILLKAERG